MRITNRNTNYKTLPNLIRTSDQIADTLLVKAHVAMNRIAQRIVYYGGQVDLSYTNNRNRYFEPNRSCCNKVIRVFGYEGRYERKINYACSPLDAQIIPQAQKIILDFIWGAFSYTEKKQSLNLDVNFVNILRFSIKFFIDINECTCSEQCMILMFALLDDNTNNIKEGDIELVFLKNNHSSLGSYDKKHENHFILKVKDCYFDPLTNTSYNKAESLDLGLNYDNGNVFKLKGLKDEYYVKNRLIPTKSVLKTLKMPPKVFCIHELLFNNY